ncbi:hypothetical protein EYF80_015611 [Liparis tanakae]|uniref:Uncharacterized protein n=1 Tax=Liparis tanakae TaxID=230148 RepID=A0A4Z2I7Y6_9TELE|nr:hypothetical protein EYF80_015611 [Liparis tanakae]
MCRVNVPLRVGSRERARPVPWDLRTFAAGHLECGRDVVILEGTLPGRGSLARLTHDECVRVPLKCLFARCGM